MKKLIELWSNNCCTADRKSAWCISNQATKYLQCEKLVELGETPKMLKRKLGLLTNHSHVFFCDDVPYKIEYGISNL